jgi:hypothetical protein
MHKAVGGLMNDKRSNLGGHDMRKALMALASAAGLVALACATPAAAMGGHQLPQNQPVQAPEAAPYGVSEGKVYYAQAPAAGGYVGTPSGGYVQAPPPRAGAIEPPPGAFMQTLGTIIYTPFQIIVTPWLEVVVSAHAN